MKQISKEHYFWLKNGEAIRSVEELAEKIPNMNEFDFAEHVQNHDFVKWIEFNYGRSRISDQLRSATTKEKWGALLSTIISETTKSEQDAKSDEETKEDTQFMHDEVEIFREKQKLRDERFQELTNLGDREFQERNFSQSRDYYNKALELRPDNLEIKNKVHDVERSIELLDKLKLKNQKGEGKNDKDTAFEMQIESYKERFIELKEEISEVRRQGKDPFMADLKLMNFNAKLNIFKQTRASKDANAVENILIDARKELDECKAEEEMNIKKEVEEGAKKLLQNEARAEG